MNNRLLDEQEISKTWKPDNPYVIQGNETDTLQYNRHKAWRLGASAMLQAVVERIDKAIYHHGLQLSMTVQEWERIKVELRGEK